MATQSLRSSGLSPDDSGTAKNRGPILRAASFCTGIALALRRWNEGSGCSGAIRWVWGHSRAGRWALLFARALFLGAALPAQAEDCSEPRRPSVLDGFAGDSGPVPAQHRGQLHDPELPGRDEHELQLPDPARARPDERWLIIFDNVVHTGQMSCNAVQGHKIWFTNGSSSGIHQNCQNLLIPVEKIDKQNPPGPPDRLDRRAVHLPARDPGPVRPGHGHRDRLRRDRPTTCTASRSSDDLNATGVDLTYLSHTAYWLETSGAPVAAHVLERGRRAHLRQHSDRPGRDAVHHRDHGRARGHARERARDAVHQHRQVGLRAADRRRVLRAAAGRVGHLAAAHDRGARSS